MKDGRILAIAVVTTLTLLSHNANAQNLIQDGTFLNPIGLYDPSESVTGWTGLEQVIDYSKPPDSRGYYNTNTVEIARQSAFPYGLPGNYVALNSVLDGECCNAFITQNLPVLSAGLYQGSYYVSNDSSSPITFGSNYNQNGQDYLTINSSQNFTRVSFISHLYSSNSNNYFQISNDTSYYLRTSGTILDVANVSFSPIYLPGTAGMTGAAFTDVGFGNLSGANPADVIGGKGPGISASAVLNVNVSNTATGATVVDTVDETLDDHSFSLTPHAQNLGSTDYYEAGFTFNVATGSSLTYTPDMNNLTDDQTWELVEGIPTPSVPGSVVNGNVSGGLDPTEFENLSAGKYTLLFFGVANGNLSFSGTISAVPLPGSLAMFGSALFGLTGLAEIRRKMKKTSLRKFR